jgi:hypothetical protein
MRSASSVVALCAALAGTQAIGAEPPAEPRVRLVIQRALVAGLRYHDAASIWPQLRVGMPVLLLREPGNLHDESAVRVQTRAGTLGYLSRRDNPAIAWALDQGHPVAGRIERLERLRNGVRRVEIEVYAE